MSFEKIGLIKPILDAISELGYSEPTPIQDRTIGLVLAKKDIFATAQTGTGKTAAFLLPIIQRLRDNKPLSSKAVRVIVMTPTRELAIQIKDEADKYAKYMNQSISLLVGGKSLESQEKQLKNGVDILIATPGRLREHILNKSIDLKFLEIFVVDEADRMLDMGFVTDIRLIHAELPKRHQTLLFSATYNDKVRKLSRLILKKPEFIETAKQNKTVDAINQLIYLVDADRKAELLSFLIGSKNYQQVLVFTRTKKSADILVEELKLDGLKAEVIHGDKTLAQRNKTLTKFKKKEIRVLVATDIASRGIDIEQLPQVINYELPSVAEDYIHRIGRTGRAGHDGEAITLLDINEKEQMKVIERLMHIKVPRVEVEGFEVDITKKAASDDIKPNRPKKIVKKTDSAKAPQKRKPAVQKKRKITKRSPR
ncbi:DEAD/DEAH box helicase [Sulfurimonas sp. HSL3-2]|uniref:DEAD/DEAH box helicase n=1 Tax=Hydrocurvibacter mobilis TaxID=3131936 RepID=UPI0031F92065